MKFDGDNDRLEANPLLMRDAPVVPFTKEEIAWLRAEILKGEYAREMRPDQRAALERLIALAKEDGVQSRTVADFLLAWWNAEECGGFNLVQVWCLDKTIRDDLAVVFAMICTLPGYPDDHGYRMDFECDIVGKWRHFPKE